jgi:hemicentin
VPTIVWLKDGQPLELSDNITIESQPDGTQTLLFKSTQLIDKGVYTCQATNIGGTVEAKMNLNVQQVKPTLKSDLGKDIVAQAGDPITLSIQASGTNPQCRWYKNDVEIIRTVEEEYEIIEEEETYTLLIKRAQPKDTGEYQAVLTNDAGQIKSKKVKVHVQKPPQLKSKPEPVVTVKEGEPARFECQFDGSPMPKVVWLRDGKPFTAKDGFDIKTDAVTGTSILTINQATSKHSGPITLRLENGVGEPIEEIVQLRVETKPQILQKPPATCEAFVNQTASIVFKCLATPEPTIRLFKNDIEIQLTGDHYELVPSETDTTLYEIRIKNVRPEDEGAYRLQIENALGSIESNVQVTTVDNLSIKPLAQSSNMDLKQHDTLTLDYVVNGRPRPEMIFMKDGKELKLSDKIQITYDETTSVCRLLVTDVGQEDQGIYSLVIKNKLGKQESEPTKVNITASIAVKTRLPESIDAVMGEQTVLLVEATGKTQCNNIIQM